MRFVRATGVSRGSYSKSSDIFFDQCRVGVTSGSRYKIYARQKSLANQRVKFYLGNEFCDFWAE
jgi:hypothetical protein